MAKSWRELYRRTQERERARILLAEKIDSVVIEDEGVARR